MKKVGTLYRERLHNRVKDAIGQNKTILFINYTRLSAPKMNNLRKNLKSVGAKIFVSKNSLVKIALKDLNFESLTDKVEGQTAVVWSNADSVEISKALINFTKECETMVISGGLLEGKILERNDIKRLSDLPSREVLLSMLLGTVQAPLSRLAGALSWKIREMLSILKQLSEKNRI